MSITIFLCLFGILVAFSYPLANVNTDQVDTRLFTPELSFLTGFCLWIPALVTAVAAIGIWFNYGRTPMQRQLVQLQSERDHLHEMVLQTYLDQISHMTSNEGLAHSTPNSALVQFAQRRTQETFAILDSQRQRQLLQFLHDAQLTGEQGVIKLERTGL